MKNEATRTKTRFLATARLQQQQEGERHSPVTASTSTSSYQDGAEYGDRYNSSADVQPLGTAGPRERLKTCSRVVLVLAIIDAVVVLCGASAFTPLILMMWGPIAGYLSSNFQLRATYTFLFYYGLRVSWDVGWLLSGGITWIVVWVFLFADAAAFGLVCFYMALLRQCTAAELAQLRDPNTAWASAFFPVRVDRTQSGDYPLN